MGEYADAYYRREVQRKHGFDPGPIGDDRPAQTKKPEVMCPKCGKRCKNVQGVRDHLRDYHKTSNAG